MANPGPATTVTPHLLIGGDSTDGTAIGINGGPVGFFGTSPAVQQGASGNTTTTAAGSTTAAYVNTTFPGASGSTAYTIGDIVTALKAYGLLKA